VGIVAAVDVAARVASLATSGEIVISQTVKDIIAGVEGPW
jgi:class 3 adenylate cyclase